MNTGKRVADIALERGLLSKEQIDEILTPSNMLNPHMEAKNSILGFNMDIMIILQVIVLLAIFIGIRLGGIAIGYAGGLGVVILGLVLGMKPGNIPWDVILIIAAAIAAISAMQQAGGLDYMVRVTEKF